MVAMPLTEPAAALRVLHILRAPLGGLFRHVCDLAKGQAAAGLKVGVIIGDQPHDPVSVARLRQLAADCALGVHIVPMGRLPGVGDALNLIRMTARAKALGADVIHGHGAKGGAYARLIPRLAGGVRVYTPHGGALHYDPRTPQGIAFFAAERLMRRRTDGFIFESDFGLRTFVEKIGEPRARSAVIHNGVAADDFAPVERIANAADFVFVGELRELKGVATLIEAISKLKDPVRLDIVGSGPDRARFEAMARELPAHIGVGFHGPMPARDAFALGRAVVLPSLHESLPYVALEAAAAGMPLIATRVGGIPEIFGPDASRLVRPGDARALATALAHALADREEMTRAAERLRHRIETDFSSARMVASVIGFYRALLDPASALVDNAGVKASLAHLGGGRPL